MNKNMILLIAAIATITTSAILFLDEIENDITGKYVQNNESYIILNNDGTFQRHLIKYHRPFAVEGEYSIDELENITLHYPYGYFVVLTKTETGLKDDTGAIYEKQK